LICRINPSRPRLSSVEVQAQDREHIKTISHFVENTIVVSTPEGEVLIKYRKYVVLVFDNGFLFFAY
jgi:hypothetical protein